MNGRYQMGLVRLRTTKELRGVWARARGRTSLGDRDEYRAACREAATDDGAFSRFKSDRRYTPVLEHVTAEQGAAYLELALERHPEINGILDAARENDRFGSPTLADYPNIGPFSPTTLRYVKVAADLLWLFGPLDEFDIVEIGGGYGGQAFVCSQVGRLRSYTLVDLPEPAALQQTYLDRLHVPGVRAITADALDPSDYDLAISNYAFSELTRPVQERYLEEVLLRSKRGYLSMTHHSPRAYRALSMAELIDVLPDARVLPVANETSVDRKASTAILVWGERS